MSINQPQLPSTVLDALQIFANTAWHNPAAFQRTHRTSASRDVAYLHLQNHSVALQYLFGNALSKCNKILVRDEYHEALQALQTDSMYERGAYIIGQPGIGKTCFLVYVLIARLRDHKPVAVQLRASDPFYAVFTHTCTLYTLSDPSPLVQEDVWALSDLRASTSAPLDIFLDISSKVVQAAPPFAKYWEQWGPQRGAEMFVMNLWSEEEIANLSSLLGLDAQHMAALAAKWGGVPQTLLEQCTRDGLQQDWKLHRAAASAVKNYVTLHTLDAQDLGTTSVIFFVVPLKDRTGNLCRNRYIVRVPTETLQSALAIALQRVESKTRIKFFQLMSTHPATRGWARNVYLNWFHSRMTCGRALSYPWLSGYSYFSQPLADATGKKNISIIRDATELTSVEPPCYWIPPCDEYPGINCAVLTKTAIFVFQVTTSYQPSSPQTGLRKLKELLPATWKTISWIFTFVGISKELVDNATTYWTTDLTPYVGTCVFDPIGTTYNSKLEDNELEGA